MDYKVFVFLVRQMRAAQNAYYRQGRKQSDLIEAKRLERLVDLALKAIENDQEPDDGPVQANLFDGGYDGETEE